MHSHAVLTGLNVVKVRSCDERRYRCAKQTNCNAANIDVVVGQSLPASEWFMKLTLSLT